MSLCVFVYDLDDDRVGRRRPSAGSIVHTDYIIIVSEDEQCRKGGDTLERYDTPTQVTYAWQTSSCAWRPS